MGIPIYMFFFCFGCATNNEAMDMMILVSKFFLIKEFMV